MKGTIFLLTLFVVSGPVFASVDIVCTPTGPNEVTVSFSTSGETELVRMISLDVQVDDPNVWIVDVNCVSEGYYVYPGSIYIDNDGNVVDWGTCAGVLDGNSMTSEQGSLYVGAANAPAEGDLFIVTLGGCKGPCGQTDGTVSVSVSENALRGGVVMEDANNPATVNLTGCTIDVDVCACDPCPCMGDITDTSGVGPPDGTVNFGDLAKIYSEMVEQYPMGDPTFVYDVGMPEGLECADLDGNSTVNFSDLIIMYSEMVTQYPQGEFVNMWYDIGCPF